MFGVSNIHFLLIHFFHILGCCCMLNCFKLLTLYTPYTIMVKQKKKKTLYLQMY